MRYLCFLSAVLTFLAYGCVIEKEDDEAARGVKVVSLDCGALEEAAAGYAPIPSGYLNAASVSDLKAFRGGGIALKLENHLSRDEINIDLKIVIDRADFDYRVVSVPAGGSVSARFELPVSLLEDHDIIIALAPQKPEELPSWESEISFDKRESALREHVSEIEIFPDDWDSWEFSRDPDERGAEESWYASSPGGGDWRGIDVPARWADTWVGGNYYGYGWYRTSFKIPAAWEGNAVMLEFGAVDEQAWVYLNGEYAGEHTVESEGLGVGSLWNRQFAIEAGPENLKYGGRNLLAVRVHAHTGAAGIWRPVRAYIALEPEKGL